MEMMEMIRPASPTSLEVCQKDKTGNEERKDSGLYEMLRHGVSVRSTFSHYCLMQN